ncbi:tripartite tricarboxylate transporter permease [Gracilibacillus sp. S3-1-1]|uniref:Tripartite tricarboxylate transporter permease n=1 Tax=Gracilibacillus pellucidus TaxID=3095368 RepID=A0ACC6M8H1_9BACI|nr:tripartite tricarboxylate transporter permease [Gracilibacillus sp. S3-1-1]MDX8047265.1 tripartite tricarboxylate transporter permease [Gracilibacillus sp. S3-1-1]
MEGALIGLQQVFELGNLLALFLGVLCGLVAGTLPGINANITIAILIPITFGMDPQVAIMLLVGVYCASCFGGSFPAILLRIPGTASSVVTTFDGFPMTQRGEGGKALGISTVASVMGGIISGIILLTLAPFLAEQALKFGPAEYFALTILGLSTVVGMSKEGGLVKNLISMVIGLLIATIGMGPQTGYPRFTFGSTNLLDGISLIPLLIGLFGISAVLEIAQTAKKDQASSKKVPKVSRILPEFKLFKRLVPTISISALIGSFIGVIPGAGMIMAIYIAYDQAVRRFKDKKFGTGVPEGVAAPEAANNAVVGSSMVPLLSLGIPGNSASALFLGALMIQGLRPGPELFTDHPDVAYPLIIGFLVAYIFVFPLGILVAKFLSGTILKIPANILNGIVIALCMTGAFAIRNNIFDVWVAIAFGVLGFIFHKLQLSYSPLILAIVLGSMIEVNLQQSLVLSDGSWLIFLQKPISLVLLIASLFFLVTPLLTKIRHTQKMRSN